MAPGSAADLIGAVPPLPARGPLVADGGAWVVRYEASNWVSALSNLAPEFPEPGVSESIWYGFVRTSLRLPGAIVVVGAVAALLIPTVLYGCHPKLRSAKGGPPWGHLACACCLTVACLTAAGALGLHAQGESFSVAAGQLHRAAKDIAEVVKLAQALNVSSTAVVADLTRLQADCPGVVQEYLGESVRSIVEQVATYAADVRRFNRTLDELPQQISSLEAGIGLAGFVVTSCLAVPWALVLGCCGAIAATIAIIEHAGRTCARRCERCELPCLGLGFIAPAMLLVSAVAAAELSIVVLCSAFCKAADKTVLDYAGASLGGNSTEFRMTKYYIAGEGPNPALQMLQHAQAEIIQAIAWVRRYGDVIARTCPQWGMEAAAVVNLETVQYSMNETELLLAPGNIYPYYKATVHEMVCRSTIPDLVGAAALQVLLALVCLPALLCTASCTIDSLIDERSIIHGIHNFDLLTQHSDGEDLEGPQD